MKLGIKLRGTLLANVLFLLITAAVFERMDYPLWPVLLVILLQMAVMLYVNVAISQPLKSFEEVLDTLSQEESEEAELVRRAGSVPYIAEVEYLIERYSTQRTRRDSAAIFDKQAELTALQSQINPHFLYNTLESIRGQALMDDNFEIAKMVEALGAFFRYSISRKGNLVTLRDEIANINNYMLIQRYRFNNRFSLEIIIDEEDEVAYDFQIPRLIIQPVVENAIFHGLEEKLEGGRVIIEVIVTEKHLIITISDNGKGIPEDDMETITRADVKDMLMEIGNKRYSEQEEVFGENMRELERVLMLKVVDTLWMDHLDEMEHVKREIGLRAYGQHDPVVEYRNVGSELYEGMLEAIKRDTVKYVLSATPRVKIEREQVAKPVDTGGDGTLKKQPKTAKKTPGRNDPCPCGSGKKYKHCCGKDAK